MWVVLVARVGVRGGAVSVHKIYGFTIALYLTFSLCPL